MKIGGVDFNIEYGELDDLLTEITDEFTLDGYDLVYDVEGSSHSSLINQDNKSFVITFSEKGESFFDLNVLYYLEPKIWELIRQIDSQLRSHDLYISASDFGESDIYYELVVSELGHTPNYKDKYMYAVKEDSNSNSSIGGMGAVSNASVSSTSTSVSVNGSGDVSNRLKSKSKKMGNPSQVSDLRFLKRVKIKRVKDI
jgi:hypothetical protein